MTRSSHLPPARPQEWTNYGIRDAIVFAAGFVVAFILLTPFA